MNREMRRRMQRSGGAPGGPTSGMAPMAQIQELQRQLEKAQEALAEELVEVSVGGGAVVIVMDGRQQVRSVTIAPEAVDPAEVETLEELVMVAINEALEKSQALATQRLGGLTSGLGLPGLG